MGCKYCHLPAKSNNCINNAGKKALQLRETYLHALTGTENVK